MKLISMSRPMIASIGNVYGVQSGPTALSTFKLDSEVLVTQIYTYHYYNKGALPGQISLKSDDGTVYGPWDAVGLDGQGGVKNAYWYVYPNVTLKAGNYTVIDSDNATWSCNAQSGNKGFFELQGY